MMAGIQLGGRDRDFEFYDFLQDKTHLQPLVRSIVVDPMDFAPVPLLRTLSNLSEIKFISQRPIRALHQSTGLTFLPEGHDTSVRALVISPDSTWVASGSDDSTIILWNTKGTLIRQWVAYDYTPILSLAFSPDSRHLVSAGEDSKMVLWSLDRDACNTTIDLTAHADTIVWSSNSNVIATALWDGTVQLWDGRTLESLHVLLEVQDANLPLVARCLTFSPDGRWLVLGLSGCNYCVYHVQSGTLHQYIQGLEVPAFRDAPTGPLASFAAAFDPTSTRLPHTSGRDAVEIWDIETRSRISLLRYPALANDVSFSPDGRLVLAVLLNRTVCVHDAHTANEVLLLEGHKDRVAKARFSPCGTYIASASWDRTVRVWKTSDGSHVATLSEHDDRVEHLAFSPDGKTLSSGGLDGTVVIRRTMSSDIVSL
ncbi:hypothetical protein GSI_01467 [Ganoderma sinense ZZ0214-1]|uniref:Uncharacterized protein n=1 Tax=Ganoderma sinense ZZ0214-1 TaxID=1077348 RepID=A0A2G8SPV6_9APHY|nr:hypothetical protein GSI_01467 [Ganoderma sinense ZZ0214-1]